MAMSVPQGPGSALRFITEEPSTCFTPNFQSAATQETQAQAKFQSRGFKSIGTVDFDKSMDICEEAKW